MPLISLLFALFSVQPLFGRICYSPLAVYCFGIIVMKPRPQLSDVTYCVSLPIH